ncbi:MAG TPA: type III secretion system chaperone [Ilumatobacteraceae bacterium]|nr:type III secretion system chaperone [Ilumatobacteraceae bacterium]
MSPDDDVTGGLTHGDLTGDLNAALAAASNNPKKPYQLDKGQCTITMPLPAGLADGLDELTVTVRLIGEIVSFVSPLAHVTEPEIPADAATALLRRQFFAQQTDGAGFALADREDVLVAQYHWIPTGLTVDAFAAIFGRFVAATLRLRDEVAIMSAQGAPFTIL